jgi:hypothetical protein
MSEAKLVNEILIEFGARADCRLLRQNTGAARDRRGGFVRFGIPGQADISGILAGGRRIEIECKSPTGRQSEDQRRWQAMIEKFGGLYVLARSTEDVRAALQSATGAE